jgi:hypothetical protein
VSGQVRGKIKSRKNDLKSFSSLPLHAQGRRRTMSFKTALFRCSIFFLRKRNVIRKNPKMGYDNNNLAPWRNMGPHLVRT